jgi:uncharacterized protein with HEPN domain
MHRTVLHFLDDIKDAIDKIQTYTAGTSYEKFLADQKTKDAVVRNFEIIGEAVKNLPEEFKSRHPSVAWKQVAGLRDVMAHGYYRVDYEVLWGVITDILPGFKTEIAKILRLETLREKKSQK